MNMLENEDRFYVDIGFQLKRIRQHRKVSQDDLAKALGVVQQTIQKYESGEIRLTPANHQAVRTNISDLSRIFLWRRICQQALFKGQSYDCIGNHDAFR